MANYDQKGQNAHTQINADTVNVHVNSNDLANQLSKSAITNGFKIRVFLTMNKVLSDRKKRYELYIDNQLAWSDELISCDGLIIAQHFQKGFHKLVFRNTDDYQPRDHPDVIKTLDLTSDIDIHINVNKSIWNGSESTVITV